MLHPKSLGYHNYVLQKKDLKKKKRMGKYHYHPVTGRDISWVNHTLKRYKRSQRMKHKQCASNGDEDAFCEKRQVQKSDYYWV
jgi:hypothetical protein